MDDKDTKDDGKTVVKYKSVTGGSKGTYIFGGTVIVVGLILGVIRYTSKKGTRQRLMRKVQQCKLDKLDKKKRGKGLPVSDECKEHLKKLASDMPDGCSKVLATMEEAGKRTPQNLLLYAILTGRSRRWRDKKIDAKALEGDECLEKAILLVHEAHRDKKEAPAKLISGLDGYNIAELNRLESWSIRARIVSKLSLQSAANIYDRLHADARKLRKALPAKADQEAVTKALRKALLPRLAPLYERVLKVHLAKPGQSKAEAAVKLPAHLDDDIGRWVTPKDPLGKKLLEMHLVRLPQAAAGEVYLVRWHRSLFQKHLLEQKAWQAAVVARLKKSTVHHLGMVLGLLEAYPELPVREGKKIPDWFQRSLAMLTTQIEPSHRVVRHLYGPLLKLAVRQLPEASVQRLLLMNGLRFPPGLQTLLKSQWRKAGHAGELARFGLAAALALGRGQHKDFAWLRSPTDFPVHSRLLRGLKPASCATGCDKPFELRLAERANLAEAKKKHNLYLKREALEQLLKSPDANQRILALVAAAYYPMRDRLVLVEAGLGAKEPSVRAFAVLSLTLGLYARADITAAATRLVKLAKDPSWLVRLMVFHRLWLLQRAEELKPFMADPTPQIVAGWRKRLASWKTKDLIALLQRKDRAAGVVLSVLAARAKLKKEPWPIDWKAVSALSSHADPWTRLQLMQHFGVDGKELLDWGALLDAKELTVRAAALDFWVDRPATKAITKHEARLVRLLDDPHLGIKRLAARVLARMGTKAAIKALGKLSKHPACPLRNVAGEALAKQQGKSFKKSRCAFELHGL